MSDIARRIQVAMLGEVPPSLRFIYAREESDTLYFDAVFTDDAPDEHIECAHVILTEIIAGGGTETKVVERIERNSLTPWKRHEGNHLYYLRYGEFSES